MTKKRTVTVTGELEVPAGFLWQTISDFEHIDQWTDLKVRAINGSGIGCTRAVEMESGLLVTERLLVCDSLQMVFRYDILEPNPYPMRDYIASATVKRISEQRSRLEWSGSYVAVEGADPARTDRLLEKVYRNGIVRLQQHYAKAV